MSYDRSRGIACAPLLVPKDHPYFFDHPLDHVPGILLLEGVFQLFAQTAYDRVNPSGDQEIYIKKVDISFQRWCEQDVPIQIELIPKENASSSSYSLAFEGRIFQKKKTACRIDLEGGLTASKPAPGGVSSPGSLEPPGQPRQELRPEGKFVHKLRPENVVIANLRKEPEEGCTCDLLKPPEGHILSGKERSCYSMLYLLETIRQFSLLTAHTYGGISLDASFILLSFRFSLRRPVFRHETLRLNSRRQPAFGFGGVVMGTIEVILYAGDEPLGEGSIKSLAVHKEIYKIQRWKKKK